MGRCFFLTAIALLVVYVSPSTGSEASARQVVNAMFDRLELPPPPPTSRGAVAETLTFNQLLDHFNASNNATWTQRYYRNKGFYLPGGPVMLFIGAEAELPDGWVLAGNMVSIAAQLGGLCLALEHRFYGKSRPLPDLTTKNLQYLSAQQALADIANFIQQYQADNPEVAGVPWVVFGGSYAGNLAAWSRLTYPNLIAAAVASSAPVQANITFPEYYEMVGNVVGQSDPECLQDIQAATQEFEKLVQTQAGADNITQYYSLCSKLDITRTLDVASLERQLESLFSSKVQTVFTTVLNDVRQLCAMARQQTGTPLQRMAKMILLGKRCVNANFSSSVAVNKNTTYTSGHSRQWTWQTCTEFGYFFTMDSPKQPFGRFLKAEITEETCKQVFGKEYNLARTQRGVDATNAQFGGRKPNVTNVVFVNGGLDPWQGLGVLKNLSDTAVAVFIPGVSHCTDTWSDSASDSADLRNARVRIRQLVAKFIGYQPNKQQHPRNKDSRHLSSRH